MKIAIVSDAIYPYNKGGKEKRIHELSRRISAMGHVVDIYSMKWWEGENERTENGVGLHAISKKYPLYSGQRRSIKQALLFSLSCFKLIKKDFDILDADHMPHLILFPLKTVAILKKKKMVVTWNEFWGREYWVEYMGKLGYVSALVERLSLFTPTTIVSVSKHTTNKLKANSRLSAKIVTVPNGIDVAHIGKVKKAAKKSDVIFAGRLLANKNIDVLLRAIYLLVKNNPNILCLIIGEGPEKNSLIKLAKELRLSKNVEFFDFFEEQNDLYSLLKSSKVFVLPSTREGFGIAALEANACGIGVITVKHKDNAAAELINGYNGVVAELSPASIAKSIKKLLDKPLDPELCRKSAAFYDWSKIATQLEGVYLENL